MTTYIALLRGINVGGQKKVLMMELRTVLGKFDFKDVQTYIQSGNIVFGSPETKTAILEDKIKAAIFQGFGIQVPVLVKSGKELEEIFDGNPYTDHDDIKDNKIYFVILKEKASATNTQGLEKESYENEKFVVTENCVYLACARGYGNAKLNNNLLERKLKVEATTRNYRTLQKLIEMAKNREK
ncbi:MAG: DUF1697 domain-containing protein [Maribacter sp.]|nr:DUF1697 domain-containing protein [Maribacter sp.]